MSTSESGVPPPLQLLQRRLSTACGGDERRLFVLLDAARIGGLKALLDELKHPYACLYRGDAEAKLDRVAPYLAPLRLEGSLLPWFILNEEAYRSAVFVVADAELETLRGHLRRYLLVQDARGMECYFRFYDTRVLAPFFEASSPAEAFVFFGPMQFLMAAAPDEPAAEVKLRVWRKPDAPRDLPTLPGANHPFCMRPEHETVFSRDMLARYEHRCKQYLRSEYPERLAARTDEDLAGTIAMARRLADHLEIGAGLNVTHVAEALVLSATKDEFAAIASRPRQERSGLLVELRQSLRMRETVT